MSAKNSNMEYEEYVNQYFGITVEDFEKDLKDDAAFEVLVGKVTSDIITRDKLTLTDEEYNAGLNELALQYGVTVDDVTNAFPEDELYETILNGLAVDTLLDNLMK